jgi:hypothetical protein
VTHVLRLIGDALSFTAEMSMLAALCYWGIRTGTGKVAKALLAIGAMAAVITVWGVFFAAAGHPVHLPLAVEILGKLAVFGTAALALRSTGRTAPATWFAAVAAASVVLEYATS